MRSWASRICQWDQQGGRRHGHLGTEPECRFNSEKSRKQSIIVTKDAHARSLQTLGCLKRRQFCIMDISDIWIVPWETPMSPEGLPCYQMPSPVPSLLVSLACWICTCHGLPFLEHITWKRYFRILVSVTYSTQKLTYWASLDSSTKPFPG